MNRRTLLQSVLAIPALLVGKVMGQEKPKPQLEQKGVVAAPVPDPRSGKVLAMTILQGELVVATEHCVYFLAKEGEYAT